MKDHIRIGSRRSKLALRQTELAEQALLQACPYLQTEIVPFQTRGDKILDKPLWEIGSKGLFASEFEEMLLRDEIDIAIHSAKDLPIFLAEGLEIVGVISFYSFKTHYL
jgi:porphobilinogen deaminase